MAAVWKVGEAKVDDVRELQPRGRRSAYTTIQTVLNRLVERGLLERERRGRAFVYRARYEESEYLARTISERLSHAGPDTRKAAIVSLVEGLQEEELDDLARMMAAIKRARVKD